MEIAVLLVIWMWQAANCCEFKNLTIMQKTYRYTELGWQNRAGIPQHIHSRMIRLCWNRTDRTGMDFLLIYHIHQCQYRLQQREHKKWQKPKLSRKMSWSKLTKLLETCYRVFSTRKSFVIPLNKTSSIHKVERNCFEHIHSALENMCSYILMFGMWKSEDHDMIDKLDFLGYCLRFKTWNSEQIESNIRHRKNIPVLSLGSSW